VVTTYIPSAVGAPKRLPQRRPAETFQVEVAPRLRPTWRCARRHLPRQGGA
jgi:hypothetical protein